MKPSIEFQLRVQIGLEIACRWGLVSVCVCVCGCVLPTGVNFISNINRKRKGNNLGKSNFQRNWANWHTVCSASCCFAILAGTYLIWPLTWSTWWAAAVGRWAWRLHPDWPCAKWPPAGQLAVWASTCGPDHPAETRGGGGMVPKTLHKHKRNKLCHNIGNHLGTFESYIQMPRTGRKVLMTSARGITAAAAAATESCYSCCCSVTCPHKWQNN